MKTREELSSIIEDYISSLPFASQPRKLYDPIEYALDSSGKRLRPLMLLTAHSVFNPEIENAVSVAAAVEVFHNFTLLHDDIMDNAMMRRNRDTVHAKWGSNRAILSGDAMLIYAYKLLQEVEAIHLPEILCIFNRMSLEVCEGQQYDMDFESSHSVSMEDYMEMIRLKTSALIGGSAKIGAILGGADKQQASAVYKYALELGTAFQIQDDYLDAFGTTEKLGKNIGGDIVEGKKTFLYITALSAITSDDGVKLLELLHDVEIDSNDKIAKVTAIYESLNVAESAQQAIQEHLDNALEALLQIDLPEQRLAPLRDLAMSLTDRSR